MCNISKKQIFGENLIFLILIKMNIFKNKGLKFIKHYNKL